MLPYLEHHFIAQSPAWAFRDFEYRAKQIAAELTQRKVRSISLWMEDGAQLACVLLGAWFVGVRTLFPANDTPESLAWANENADLWITDRTDFHQPNSVLFSEFGLQIEWQKDWQNRPLFDVHNQTEIWLKTSGSTGEAKTIVKTARQLWLGACALAEALPFNDSNDIHTISTVSIQHVYGLTVHIMMSLVKGWQIGRIQQFYPECIMREAEQVHRAIMVSSPAMLSSIDWQKMPISSRIEGIISSGGALPATLSDEIRSRVQHPLVEIYGSTETGPIAIRQDSGLWRILPNSRLGSDAQGALWIEADWLARREQTADVVEFEAKGFRLLGRADRIVKIADKRIALVGVEQALMQHLWVEDCYIAQHPQKSRLVAWVGLTAQGIEQFREKGRRALIHQLKQALEQTQEKAAVPRFWRFTDKLPRNSQSKINKAEFERICVATQTDAIWLNAEQTENGHRIEGKVPLDLVFLTDHFADFPLVPGVVELQWITDQISEFFGFAPTIARFEQLKFQKFLRPADRFQIQLQWDAVKQRIKFQLLTEREVCCSGFALMER